MSDRRVHLLSLGLIALAAAALYWMWGGWFVLDPLSLGWLQVNDRAMHTLGWWFYRDAPWGWPPGASSLLGLELSSSVALSDSLPLFAMPLKLVAAWLPERYQFWGAWLLVCFVLQGWLGYLIARELRFDAKVAILAGLFCVIQPAFLHRLDMHMALAGHWTLLAALYLYVRTSPPPAWAWPLLLALVSAIHGYLLAMCCGIWAVSVVQRLWMGRAPVLVLVGEGALAVGSVALVLWGTGTLMVSSYGSSGFGIFRMNLLALVDGGNGWSHVWPGVPQASGDYEGMNFAGLGIGLMLVLAVVSRPWPDYRAALRPRWLPLVVFCVGSTLFAISNQVALSRIELFTVPLPDMLLRMAEIFRSSGRMFWPVGYLIVFAVIANASRVLGGKTVPVLAMLLVAQVVDTSFGWTNFRRTAPVGRDWAEILVHPAWDVLGERYARVRALPTEGHHRRWLALSQFALKHRIGTDTVYLGRIDGTRLAALQTAGRTAVAAGRFEPDTIYVVDRAVSFELAGKVRPDDLFAILDGLLVFAPGGQAVLEAAGLEVETHRVQAETLAPGTYRADADLRERYLLDGWSGAEDWGIWTDGARAAMAFRPLVEGPAHLKFKVHPYLGGSLVDQTVKVSVNGQSAAEWTLSEGLSEQVLPLPGDVAGSDVLVTFEVPGAARPADFGGSTDKRLLGMGLEAVELMAGPAP